MIIMGPFKFGPLENKLQWNFDKNTKFFIHKNAFENITYQMAAILSRVEMS